MQLIGEVARSPSRRAHVLGVLGWPSGMTWLERERALVVADTLQRQLLIWRDDTSFFRPIPLSGAPALGWAGLAAGGDSFYVARPGQGANGGVLRVGADGTTSEWPGLDPSRRRSGLVVLDNGSLLTTFFVARGGSRGGGVARIGARGEQIILQGMRAPVSITAIDDRIYILDQDAQLISRYCISRPRRTADPIASVPHPAFLCAGPGHSLLVTTLTGQLLWIDPAGSVRVLLCDQGFPRGVACDRDQGRVFLSMLPRGQKAATLSVLEL